MRIGELIVLTIRPMVSLLPVLMNCKYDKDIAHRYSIFNIVKSFPSICVPQFSPLLRSRLLSWLSPSR